MPPKKLEQLVSHTCWDRVRRSRCREESSLRRRSSPPCEKPRCTSAKARVLRRYTAIPWIADLCSLIRGTRTGGSHHRHTLQLPSTPVPPSCLPLIPRSPACVRPVRGKIEISRLPKGLQASHSSCYHSASLWGEWDGNSRHSHPGVRERQDGVGEIASTAATTAAAAASAALKAFPRSRRSAVRNEGRRRIAARNFLVISWC